MYLVPSRVVLPWLGRPLVVIILSVQTDKDDFMRQQQQQQPPQYITLDAAAKLTPIPVSQCTIWRWCSKGFRFEGVEQPVLLQYICVGRKMFTTEKWMEDFFIHLRAAKTLSKRSKRKPGMLERLIEIYHAEAVLRRAKI